MTTEAVVINRIGVALATDSAVTITGRGKSKVFDTGDKLFELDLQYPVGLMINGNMDWLGVPWELIIKDYRERPEPERIDTLEGTLDQFLTFARDHKAYTKEAETRYVCGIAVQLFERIKRATSERLFADGSVGPDDDPDEKILGFIEEEAKRLKGRYEAAKRADSLASLTVQQVLKAHTRELGAMITHSFDPVEVPRRVATTLKRMVAAALLSSVRSSFTTGIVVAGFAPGDLFPSLAIASVDSAVCGILKFTLEPGLRIDRTDTPGRVISFAQTDVADRILSGADQQFVNKTAEFIRKALNSSKESITNALSGAGLSVDDVEAVFNAIIDATGDEFTKDFWPNARDNFQNDFNEMVALMPKQETIELAEAIVSITAIERKASSEQATVGGPVDVAFITRHEGFVWIKRKHYFEKDLNPRYFKRRFQRALPGEPA